MVLSIRTHPSWAVVGTETTAVAEEFKHTLRYEKSV
jgi:hypothetical protein